MLRSSNEIRGYSLTATDGDIDKAKDFLFSDLSWIIRYLVADTGTWLPGRQVLISPISLDKPEYLSRSLSVKLTRDQIEESPALETDKPVSRQFEVEFHRFFGWPVYWNGELAWGAYAHPSELSSVAHEEINDVAPQEKDDDPHLRSMKEVGKYHIMATDGEIGHVEDFIVDDDTWIVRYIVVDTRNWLPGKKVVVSPEWIKKVDYGEALVHMDLTQQAIKDSPEYNARTPINREYEEQLYDFHGRRYYWM